MHGRWQPDLQTRAASMSDSAVPQYLRALVRDSAPFQPIPSPEPTDAGVARLHLNESPLPPSPRVVEAVAAAAGGLNRYPDASYARLRATLATHLDIDPACLVFGNGSDMLLGQVTQAVLEPGCNSVMPMPSFHRYSRGAQLEGVRAVQVPVLADGRCDVDGLAQAVTGPTRLVTVATPNNPTGGMLGASELQRLAEAVPASVPILVDEAYFEFGRHVGGPDALEIMRRYRPGPWIVVRTFSKAYGLAGLRLGYGVTSEPAFAEGMARLRPMFAVNALAEVAAVAAFSDQDHLRHCMAAAADCRADLEHRARVMGLAVVPSAANFAVIGLDRPAGPVVTALRDRGVYVGTVGPAPWDRHLRVTIGEAPAIDRFFEALQAVL